MGLFAVIGVTALWLLYGWLASAIIASLISNRKGWGEHAGIASGLLLSVGAPVLWLIAPPAVRLPLSLDTARGREPVREAVAVKWPIGRLIAFYVVSLTYYAYFWFGVTRQHVSQELDRENDHPGLQTIGFAIPILNLVLAYLLIRDVERLRAAAGLPALGTGAHVGLILLLLVPLVGLAVAMVVIAGRLNEFWEARTDGQAIELPATGWDWAAVFTPIGAILVFVVARAVL